LLLNIPAVANRAPSVDAGPDTVLFNTHEVEFQPKGFDADDDVLTWEIRDETGRVIATFPDACWTDLHDGDNTITVTVNDGHGHAATDTVVYTVRRDTGTLPPTWTSTDVGAVGAAGSSSFDGTGYIVRGSGADIWGTADEFQFAFTQFSGDFDFSGRVASVENVNQWTKAGLMIREAANAGDRHAFVLATPTAVKGVAFQRRTVTNGSSVSTAGPSTAPPEWLRLVRDRNVVTAYYRQSASDAWTTIGSQTYANLPFTVEVGLAVSSHVDGIVATATFDNVSISALSGIPGFRSVDIGAVSPAGSAALDGGTFTVKGSGADIWGTADALHFVYQPQTDSQENWFEINARVTSVENVNQWTKAGLMVRGSDSAGAAHASLFVTPTTVKGVAFQRRRAAGETSVSTAGPAITAPIWLKLIVSPIGVRAYYRTGTTTPWIFVGEDEIRFVGATIEAGLAVSSHVNGTLAAATFDNVSIHAGVTWDDRDVGAVGIAGSGHDDCRSQSEPPCGAEVTLTGSGADIWGSADAFHFRFNDVSHHGISARVLSVTDTDAWTKAGVMIRADFTPGAPHVMLVVTPGKGVAMQYRATANGPSAQVVAVPGVAPAWMRLSRHGSTFHGEISDDGMAWREIGHVDVALEEFAVGGLVLTSHDNAKVATAVFDDVFGFLP